MTTERTTSEQTTTSEPSLEIVYYPHPALRWSSKPVNRIDADLRATAGRMLELMREAGGVGLAANQVALPYRLFVAKLALPEQEADEESREVVFINPEIVSRKGSMEGEEGCLSLPELYGQVRRAEEIVVDAFDLQGRGFEMQLNGLPSRIVQHETDHLEGVLFIDRMSESARRELEPRLHDFERHFRRQQETGHMASDEALRQQLLAREPS